MKTVVVIGAGPAGTMAAIQAATKGFQVILIEKNEKIGKKLFITGKGRCNLTNACETEDFFQNVITNPKFLYSSIYAFPSDSVMDFFEKRKCHLKIERGNRVFPKSDHSSDVIKVLKDELLLLNVKTLYNTEVTSINVKDNKVTSVELKNNKKIDADAVIMATGGKSYPSTGSDGSALQLAEKIGHKIIKCKPALVPIRMKGTICKLLQGLSLKNVELCVKEDDMTVYEGFGEMLFTHFGMSGPLILSASSYLSKNTFEKKITIEIDLKPALSFEQLDKRLMREFDENKNKQFKNCLDSLFPAKLIPIMIERSKIIEDKKVTEITKEERQDFVNLIKKIVFTVDSLCGFEDAIITQGGVCCKEINPSTMESKLVKGVYFAGEVLDVDAMTGGFNLQIAWATGFLAGISIEGE